MWRWLPTLWLAFVVVRYSRTSFNSVLSPFNPGWDVAWAVAWLGVITVILASMALLTAHTLHRVWAWVFGTTAIAIVVLSASIPPALTALGILVICAGTGEIILNRLGANTGSLVERLVMATPAGMGLLALSQLALAAAGFFHSWTTWLLIAALAAAAIPGIRHLRNREVERGALHFPLLVQYDLVLGNRMQRADKVPFIRRLANRTSSAIVSALCHQQIHDSQTGFRAYRIDVVRSLRLVTHGYELESEVLIKAARHGFRIGHCTIQTIYSGEKSRFRNVEDSARFLAIAARSAFWR